MFLLLLAGSLSYGQGGVKGGEDLSKEEVAKALTSGRFCFDIEGYGHFCGSDVEKGSLKVLGIRTDSENGIATVYYEFIPTKEKQTSILEQKPHYMGHHPHETEKGPMISGSLTLFRFDDGTWFIPFQDKLITK